MNPPERSPERDAAIVALLPLVATHGWTIAALTQAAGPDADLLFPRGTPDMVEAYCDLADRWMEADASASVRPGMRLPDKVRCVVAARLERNLPYKDAVRRALGVLGVPGHPVLAAQCTARTIDTIWHAAGDTSADFSWYTKRAILTAIYGATLLFWLRDGSDDNAPTLAFLDRRLAATGRFRVLRHRMAAMRPKGWTHAGNT